MESEPQNVNNNKTNLDNDADKKYKIKAAIFLGTVASISAIAGFSKTLLAAKKQEHKFIETANAKTALLMEDGTMLAMRALGWGTIFAILGTGSICFGIWKLSGAKNMQEFREKIGSKLPQITKSGTPTSRTEFDGLTDLMKYLTEWGK